MAGLNEADASTPQPVTVPAEQIDQARVTRPAKPHAVWVNVAVDDGTERREQGFALAWTEQHVLVQVLWPKSYYKGALEIWVEAKRVSRREITPQWIGK